MATAAPRLTVAAAPVVALGAPLGALIVERMSRAKTLLIVSTMCVAQYVWAVVDREVTGVPLVTTVLAIAIVYLGFHGLSRLGDQLRGGAAGDAATEDPLALLSALSPSAGRAQRRASFERLLDKSFAASQRHRHPLSILTLRLLDTAADEKS